MATYGEFSSLLQLGVGIGVGLSLFRALVNLRLSGISQTIEGELIALRGGTSEFARQKMTDYLELKLEFSQTRDLLDRILFPFMVCAVGLAVANLSFLVFGTLNSTMQVSPTIVIVLLGISFGAYILIWLVLEIVAWFILANTYKRLHELQTQNG